MSGWEWDDTLFAGTAKHYEQGRPPYAPGLADVIAGLLPVAVGEGRMIDVGCGPGTLTLRLHQLFAGAVGIDPDPEMIAEARRNASAAGIADATFIQSRAEDLPLDLGVFDVAFFGQSFHWMDRELVAGTIHGMLSPGGLFILVTDRKNTPPKDRAGLVDPAPPYVEIEKLVRDRLGPVRRAGQGVLSKGTPAGEGEILARADFQGPDRIIIPTDATLHRTVGDVVSFVYSLSSSAPALFGDDLGSFDAELRSLLVDAAPAGRFAEPLPDSEILVWRR